MLDIVKSVKQVTNMFDYYKVTVINKEVIDKVGKKGSRLHKYMFGAKVEPRLCVLSFFVPAECVVLGCDVRVCFRFW